MKYCPFCGSGLDDEMIFCPKCGKRFRGAHESSEPDVHEIEPPCTEGTETFSSTTEQAEPVPVTEDVAKSSVEQTINGTQIIPPASRKKSKKTLVIGIIIAAIILIAAVSCVLFLNGKDDGSKDNSNVTNSSDADEGDAIDNSNKGESVISSAAKSVLFLETYDDDGNLVATASGFVARDQTTLITNYHVIDGAYRIVAFTPDKESSIEVKNLLAYDSVLDLAILECAGDIGVTPLVLGDSDSVFQGDSVYAVGYPLGVAHTLSNGVVGSRYIDDNGADTIQITAAISSGSSGGALFNEAGEVVGVICASYIEGQNLNLAIAINELIPLFSAVGSPITLSELYSSKPHPYTLEYVLQHRERLDGTRVTVEAYVSSVAVLNMNGDMWVDYIIVSDFDEVLGYIGYGYSETFFEDADYVKYYVGYENSRIEAYEALGFELTEFEVIYEPGEKILVSGVVRDVTYVNLAHGIDWHHVNLDAPKIVE